MLALWNRAGRHTSLKCYRFIPKTAQNILKRQLSNRNDIEFRIVCAYKQLQRIMHMYIYIYIYKYIYSWKKETWSLSNAPKTNRNRTSRNHVLQMEFWTPKHPNVRDQGTHSESLPCPRVISSTRMQMQHLTFWHFVCNVWCPCKCNSVPNESYKIWGNLWRFTWSMRSFCEVPANHLKVTWGICNGFGWDMMHPDHELWGNGCRFASLN